MALIKTGMSIYCRTREEVDAFREIAIAEGHRFRGGCELDNLHMERENGSFQVGYGGSSYPSDITIGYLDKDYTKKDHYITTNIEASVLFRNHIISRRRKNGSNTT